MTKIGIGSCVAKLTGIGYEYLVVNGVILAVFFDGWLVGSASIGNNDETKGV